MTPQERRKYLDAYSKVVQAKNAQNKARAQALHAAKEQTEIERINEERLKAWEEYQRQAASQAQAQKAQEENNKGGFFGGLGYVGEKFSLGIMRGLEGISDFLVGGTADLLGFDEFADERMKTDWFNYNHADEWYKPSGAMSFIGDVACGVGGMLPAIGVSFIPGAGQALATATFGVSAAGQAVSEQTKKNGSADGKEWLYGIGSGALETGIEMASGGIGGSQAGKVLGKQLGKSTAGKIATTFVSEGLEEVASDILDPALQRVTGVDKTATVDWSGLPRTFAVGGATGAVMGGGSRALNAARAGGFTNLNVAENAQELQNELAENNVRQAQGKKSTYTQKDLAFHRDRLSKNLQKLTPEARQAFLSQNKNIAPFFNEDGTVRQFTAQDNVAQNSPDSAAENKNLAAVGARHSIKNVNGKDIVSIDTDQDIFEGVERKDYGKVAREYIKNHFRGKDVEDVRFTSDSEREYTQSKYSRKLYAKKSPQYDAKMKGSTELDNFVKTGKFLRHEKAKHPHSYNEGGYDRYEVEFELGGQRLSGEMLIAVNSQGKKMFYDIVNINESDLLTNGSKPEISAKSLSTNSIRSKIENVNSFSEKSSEKNSQTSGNINEEAYSRSVQGRETEFAYAPVSAESMPTETAKKVMKNVTLLSNGKANVVLTAADMRTADGQVAAGQFINGVLYLNANATEYEHAMLVGSHELVHSLEGTKEYLLLSRYIGALMKADPKLQDKYNYEAYREAYDNSQSFELSEETKEYQALTEICADFVAGEILNTESAIYRLTSQHRNVAVRMLDWVKGALKRLSMGKAERETYRAMKTAEKLLSAALEASTGGITLEEVEAGVQKRAAAEMQETDTSAETEQKETTDNSSVDNSAPKSARYQIKQFNKDKYDFDESIKSVAGMKAVAELTGNEFVIGTPGLYNQIADYFDSLNNNAFNPDLGDVELKRRGVKDSVAHGLGELKTVAFKAVPNIIQKGKVVDYQTNWKGNAYDTAVIAAPITIANDEYYAAVVVRRTDTKQRFYLHEIDIKKRQAVQTEAATENSSKELGGSPINSIFEKIRKVNTFDENSSKNIPARHFLDVNARKTDPKEAMRQYLHRIDLTQETKDALHEKYGEETARRIINIWDNTSGKAGVDMSTVTRELADKGAYIDAYYPEDVLYEMDREMRGDTITDYDFNKQIRRVTETREKQSLGQKAQAVKLGSKEEWVDLQIQATNVQAGIEAAARRLGVQGMEAKTHKARCASAAALNMITNGQWNAAMTKQVGKSLDDIFAPIMAKGDAYYQEFCEFVLHWHNEDRMRLEERAQREMRSLELNDYALRKILERKDISEGERNRLLDTVENGKRYKELKAVKNKPVFSEKITAKESVARRAELLRKHPEFLEAAKELWGYFDNLLQYRVDYGLITQELADGLRKKYPHYVPTVRDTDNVALGSQKKRTHEVKKTIKNATGGDSEILDISLMAINQTKAVVKAAAENDILNALYEAAERAQDFTDIELLEKEKVEDAEIDYEADKPKENRAVFYRNGEKVTVLVSKQVFVGLEAYRTNTRAETRAEALLVKMNSITKALVTQWNPLFLVRNAVRDFQEAMFYTKNGMGKFIMNLPRAVAMMKRKDRLWQIYLAMGGTASGYYNNETGIYDRRGKVRKGFGKLLGLLETANSVVEQLPRFNEFVLSVKNGASYEQALLDSADVTTNFSRGGKLTKRLNRAVIPFLNPSVQGWSKLWRSATGRKTARKWTAFVLKCMAVGLSVGLVNDLINGDDEEYQKLRQSDKDNYYLLPVGEKFIKIPKGRVVAFFGSFADRSKQLIKGEEGAFDDWMSSAAQMVSPIQNIGRSFFAPFKDVATNTTWYGGEIEGQALQSYAPSERYDESTSSIAVWLGKTFDYSPKKIHYLIDQYSGVIGDIILPATTAKAEQDMLSSAFVIDPVLSNEISTEFYDLLDETTYAKNAGNVTAVLELRYLNSVSSAVSDMYKQKREIANDTTLSDKEKQTQTRVVQELINQTLAAAISGVEDFEQLLIDMDYEAAATALAQNKLYADFSEKQRTSAAKKLTDYYYAKAYSKLSGERYSYKYYLYDCVGGEKAATYLTAIAAIEGEKDSKGKTVANSRKKKIVAYIEDLRLSALQKYVLLLLAGYTPSDKGKGLIKKYLTEQGFTKAEIEEIL